MAERVSLDFTGCLKDRVGSAGFTRPEIEAAGRKATPALKRLRRELDRGSYGFDSLLDDRQASEASRAEGRRLARLADTLLVDGIGGSALGALALETALRPAKRKLVMLDNVDPEGVDAKLKGL